MITFAILAHNEAESVGRAVAQALAAAENNDRVVVVDSASTDDTVARAREAGAEVLRGPLGKGAAMRFAAERVDTSWICYLDADFVETDRNVAHVLRDAVTHVSPDHAMVVGEFTDPPPEPLLSNTIALYPTLVRALFPEADGRFGTRPLSGFRAVRPELTKGLPPDFGAEAYLNLTAVMSGRPFSLTHIGLYRQRFRYKPDMGREIGRAILDVATEHGRLHQERRSAWNLWVDRLVEVMAGHRGDLLDGDTYRERLFEAAAAPLPDTGAGLTRE